MNHKIITNVAILLALTACGAIDDSNIVTGAPSPSHDRLMRAFGLSDRDIDVACHPENDEIECGPTLRKYAGPCMTVQDTLGYDGTLRSRTKVDFEYDARERLVFESTRTMTLPEPYSNQGTFSAVAETTIYNDDGTVARREFDAAGDGQIDSRTDFTYDDEGRQVRSQESVDGKVRASEEVTYDADGRPVRIRRDYDGVRVLEHRYSEDGRTVQLFDVTDDEALLVAVEQRDEEGRRVSYMVYRQDYRTTLEESEDQGQRVFQEHMTSEAVPTAETRYTYDADGRLIAQIEVSVETNEVVSDQRWIYDGDVLLRTETNRYGENRWERLRYDTFGNLLVRETSRGGTVFYGYECWN